MKTSISFLKSLSDRYSTLRKLYKTDTDYIHVDIMDGIFVSNKNLSIEECNELLKNSPKPLDIHLMVQNPIDYIEELAFLNIQNITVHVELGRSVNSYIKMIHSKGFNAGLAINPETSIEELKPYLSIVDYIIVMGVTPGAGGQPLIPETINKVTELKNIREDNGYKYEIALDGGVNKENRQLLSDLDVCICGAYVCMSEEYQNRINDLR